RASSPTRAAAMRITRNFGPRHTVGSTCATISSPRCLDRLRPGSASWVTCRTRAASFAVGLPAAAIIGPVIATRASAQTATDATGAIRRLEDALIAGMKAGRQVPFSQHFDTLAPVIDQVFDLAAILQASIGLRWATLSADQMSNLQTTFRRYTISS